MKTKYSVFMAQSKKRRAKIIAMVAAGTKRPVIAKRMGITLARVSQIVNGK